MKVQTINGVPYYINEANQLFFYSKVSQTPTNSIGTWDPVCLLLQLHDNWETIVKDYMTSYREQLNEHTKTEMEKAKALQNV
jgi:hypothetical protein